MTYGDDFLAYLRPPPPTAPDEICRCDTHTPVKLMCALSENPIHCIDCNLEVEPERLALTPEIVWAVASWRNVHDALYKLWIASGDYEEFARCQLADIHSEVNRQGLAVCAKLNAIHRCYYWYFQDQSVDDFVPAADCPLCGTPFAAADWGTATRYLCEGCSIVTLA